MEDFNCKASWPGREDLTETDLETLWEHLDRDGALRAVFHDGPMPRGEFVRFVMSPANHFTVFYRGSEPLAFMWLNGHCGRSAWLHFGFLKKGLTEKETIGRAALDFCFKGGFESLLSLTPVYNLPALRFGLGLGGRLLGRLRGACPLHEPGRVAAGFLILFEKEND